MSKIKVTPSVRKQIEAAIAKDPMHSYPIDDLGAVVISDQLADDIDAKLDTLKDQQSPDEPPTLDEVTRLGDVVTFSFNLTDDELLQYTSTNKPNDYITGYEWCSGTPYTDTVEYSTVHRYVKFRVLDLQNGSISDNTQWFDTNAFPISVPVTPSGLAGTSKAFAMFQELADRVQSDLSVHLPTGPADPAPFKDTPNTANTIDTVNQRIMHTMTELQQQIPTSSSVIARSLIQLMASLYRI